MTKQEVRILIDDVIKYRNKYCTHKSMDWADLNRTIDIMIKQMLRMEK